MCSLEQQRSLGNLELANFVEFLRESGYHFSMLDRLLEFVQCCGVDHCEMGAYYQEHCVECLNNFRKTCLDEPDPGLDHLANCTTFLLSCSLLIFLLLILKMTFWYAPNINKIISRYLWEIYFESECHFQPECYSKLIWLLIWRCCLGLTEGNIQILTKFIQNVTIHFWR